MEPERELILEVFTQSVRAQRRGRCPAAASTTLPRKPIPREIESAIA